MARNRQRPGKIIYNNDATVITETPSVNDTVEVDRNSSVRSNRRNVDIPISYVIDTFAGYSPFHIDNGDSVGGECFICHARTQYPVRRLCVPCAKKYSFELHEKAMSAPELGDRTVSIEVSD